MSERQEKKKTGIEEAEEIKQILGAVSTEVPGLIRSIIASVFSEEAGRSMGKAAAAFYKELKESGMPDAVAVKMTEDYISVFTSLGDIMKKAGGSGGINLNMGRGKRHEHGGVADEVGSEVERRVKQRLAERQKEEDDDEEEED